jgi:hypothetical protein
VPNTDETATTPYDSQYRRQMDAFAPGLWCELSRVPSLPAETAEAVLLFLVDMACRPTHIRPIMIGRAALEALPRAWLQARLERAAEPIIVQEDEWDYRRLLEAVWPLDRDLVQRFALRGLGSRDRGVREAGQEFLDKLDTLRDHPDALPW